MTKYPATYEYVDEETRARAYLAVDLEHCDHAAGMQWPVAGGGVRMRLGGTKKEAQDLAREMTMKFALISPRIGGAKMVIDFDPARHEKQDVICRAVEHFADRYRRSLVTGADLNTSISEVEGALAAIGVPCAQYALARSLGGDVDERIANLNVGVHADDGGYLVNELSAGYSVFCAIRELVARMEGLTLDGLRVAIQGFGAVGGSAARFLEAAGANVVAVADGDATLFYQDGAPVSRLLPLRRAGLISPYVKGVDRDLMPIAIAHPDAIKTADADVLVPAAASYLISGNDAARISARYIVCGANNPFESWDVPAKLEKAGKIVVPDYVANSGTAAMYHALATMTPPNAAAVFEAIAGHIATLFGDAWPLVNDGVSLFAAFSALLNSRLKADEDLEVAI